jgi:hypothetical protein
MMRLRRKESDASKRTQGWKAFGESVVPLLGDANLQARRKEHVAGASNHQWLALRSNVGALTSRSFGTLRAQQLSR